MSTQEEVSHEQNHSLCFCRCFDVGDRTTRCWQRQYDCNKQPFVVLRSRRQRIARTAARSAGVSATRSFRERLACTPAGATPGVRIVRRLSSPNSSSARERAAQIIINAKRNPTVLNFELWDFSADGVGPYSESKPVPLSHRRSQAFILSFRLYLPREHDRMHAVKTLPNPMIYIWAFSFLAQICSLYFVVTRRHFRPLPLFFFYLALNILQAAFLVYVYDRFGFTSPQANRLYWISEPITLTAQTLAATELLNRVLRQYRGIWGLAWRLIAAASLFVVVYALASAGREPAWRVMIANRGYHLTFAVALISCLLMVRVYSIPINPIYRVLLGGFCFYSCSVVAGDTFLQALFLSHYPHYGDLWNYFELVVFAAIQVVWAVALRQRIAEEEKTGLLPPSVYDRLSPKINSRLRQLNDELNKFWSTGISPP
jgi:hypothetical protein